MFVHAAQGLVGGKGSWRGMYDGGRGNQASGIAAVARFLQDGIATQAVCRQPNGAIIGFDATGKSSSASGRVRNQVVKRCGLVQAYHGEVL